MGKVEESIATQLANIEKRSGKSLDELARIVKSSGLGKHGEIREMLKRDLGMGHGDANTLVHYVLRSASAFSEPAVDSGDVLAEIYTGAKEGLRPIHERLMVEIRGFGEFEAVPKKGYVSLRRKKQFAMVGPATRSQVEIGLNAKELPPSERLTAVPAPAMCQYKVRVSEIAEVDGELVSWLKMAFDAAG